MAWYIVEEDTLKELMIDSLKLSALESGGVDNWSYYGVSLQDFLEDESSTTFDEIAEEQLSTFDRFAWRFKSNST